MAAGTTAPGQDKWCRVPYSWFTQNTWGLHLTACFDYECNKSLARIGRASSCLWGASWCWSNHVAWSSLFIHVSYSCTVDSRRVELAIRNKPCDVWVAWQRYATCLHYRDTEKSVPLVVEVRLEWVGLQCCYRYFFKLCFELCSTYSADFAHVSVYYFISYPPCIFRSEHVCSVSGSQEFFV